MYMESKTILVSAQTHRELEILKNMTGMKSFEALLSDFTKEKIKTKSLFGKGKGIKKAFEREHKERL